MGIGWQGFHIEWIHCTTRDADYDVEHHDALYPARAGSPRGSCQRRSGIGEIAGLIIYLMVDICIEDEDHYVCCYQPSSVLFSHSCYCSRSCTMPYEVKQITMVTTSSSHRLLISIVSVNFPSILAEATASGSHQTTKCLQLIYTRQSSLASHQEIREWFLCRWRRLLACVSIIFINVTSCCCSCANFVIIILMTNNPKIIL